MTERRPILADGNEAAASVAYRMNEVVAIYPITPSSTMGELSDGWAALGRTNIWGSRPDVVEMQSEAGAAGAVHGSLQAGALTTTFTASQGLLLMLPNMYKIAGELLPFCMHVSARTVATHALSIFGDHSDVMACRGTGFALLASGSVQEVHDLACIGQAATLKSRVPFLHFFDGFRTSHEVAKIDRLSDEDLAFMVDPESVRAHRGRALTPDRPVLRGTAQNPDTFFQAREAAAPFYNACPAIVQEAMDRFAARTGRAYRLFDYAGHPDPERLIVLMGSGGETAHETVDWLCARGERVALLKVRLFQPFAVGDFWAAIPGSVRSIAVMDRTKEPGAVGEPLYLSVLSAICEGAAAGRLRSKAAPRVVGGRYGLASKEFTPAMVKAVFDGLLEANPKNHFTVGIRDDVSGSSLAVDPDFHIEADDVNRAVFYGLGSDGTVGANKNSIKIIGEATGYAVQGYFVYDSKKSGAMTISHLRFGKAPIRSAYLIRRANFLACNQFAFLRQHDVLAGLAPGGVFLLNAPYGPDEIWDRLTEGAQRQIIEKQIRFYVVDAYRLAAEIGMGNRINTIMQTCALALAEVIDPHQAIADIKRTIRKSYAKAGQEAVEQNCRAVDLALAHLFQVPVPGEATATQRRSRAVPPEAPGFVQEVIGAIIANKGDLLPVSAFPPDGTWPTGTTRWEKRSIAHEIPVWDPALCIQCNKCAFVCPHGAIRAKAYPADRLTGAPGHFKRADYKGSEFPGWKFTIQTAPDDCTGCALCTAACKGRDKADPGRRALAMGAKAPILEEERARFAFFLALPAPPRDRIRRNVKGSQFLEPLFEFPGACPGCGETPYIRLLTQLFGDRLLIANATGCSSIYGGNLPTTPYARNAEGRGPAWCNSLFEDNAEFGLGFRLALDFLAGHAKTLLGALSPELSEKLALCLANADQRDEARFAAQRDRVAALKEALASVPGEDAASLQTVADYLAKKSVWAIGGDGWAYDIGFGGLDHVIAGDRNVKLLVLDTELYSNTGGQQSKATPFGAVAKFATLGKALPKKDLGLIAMTYGHAYVARVAFGANDRQTLKALEEADAHEGPALVIAYSHCIAHGYDLANGLEQQRLAVESGVWPLYRYDPGRLREGKQPFQLDSREPTAPVSDYLLGEQRFGAVHRSNPERFHAIAEAIGRRARAQYQQYRQWAEAPASGPEEQTRSVAAFLSRASNL